MAEIRWPVLQGIINEKEQMLPQPLSSYSYPRDSNPAVKPILSLKKISFMQVIVADASMFFTKLFFAHENMKKPSSKVVHNRPICFHYCAELPKWPKIENSYQKFVLGTLCYIYLMQGIHKLL